MTHLKFPLVFVTLIFLLSGCKKEIFNQTTTSRSYYMGFQNSAPQYTMVQFIEALNMWPSYSDAAIISVQVPWDTLLKGTSAQNYVVNNYASIANYFRSKNLKIWVYIDPANGMNRTEDAPELVALNKSIAQPAIQSIYCNFVLAMDSVIQPDHLGLALETNAIRGLSPDSIYQGVKTATAHAAMELRQRNYNVSLSVSVQVEWAWGYFSSGSYIGVDQDFTDFPFIQELGLSSYPYIVFKDPSDIPINYYSRLTIDKSIPLFVSEGGWSSQQVGTFAETTQKQADYLSIQNQLLNNSNAEAVFQLTFTDIEISSLPTGTPSNIDLFAYLGVVDTNFLPKPALSTWKENYNLHRIN